MNIIKRIKASLARKQYDRGFAYAASQLLKGGNAESLMERASYGEDMDGKNPFDSGIRSAVDMWYKVGQS